MAHPKPHRPFDILRFLIGALIGGATFGLGDLVLQLSTKGTVDPLRLGGIALAGAITVGILFGAGGRHN